MTIKRTMSCALLALASGTAAAADTVWFVVAERVVERNESFLLPLSDPAAIAQARALIAQPSEGGIVVAKIAPGSDGLNRDVRADGQPLWAWHITEFEQFADHTIELCDGWPGFIQQDVAGYIANTDGRICMWGYTVKQELAQAPAFAINNSLDGAWFNPSTSGQGFFFDVMPAQGFFGAAWFTFAETNPAATEVGADEHRWLTAQGAYNGSDAVLRLNKTTGGYFDDPRPVQHTDSGELRLHFIDCNHATAQFSITNGPVGTMPLERVVPVASCGN
jgi:hypothetical protein